MEALFDQDYRDFEIVVVDDGSRDGTPEMLKGLQQRSPVPFIRLRQENAGPATGRNLGVTKASGRVIVFTDDDLTFDRQWIRRLVERLEQDPDAVGVEGATLPVDDPASLFRFNLDNRTGGRYYTCNMAYRRDAFLEAGGFDEAFRYPCREDSDLAFRLLDRGGTLPFEPEARAYHRNHKSSVWHPIRTAGMLGHSVYLYKKHPGRVSLPALFYPSYIVALGSIKLSVLTFIAGVPAAALALALPYVLVVARNLGREVNWKGVRGIKDLAGLTAAYALMPLAYNFYLLESLVRWFLGFSPIPARR